MANLTDMLSKFVTANTASTSGSGTLPGNTITNPKEDLKGITTRSGVTIQGPKAVNHDTEVTKDTMPPADNGSTEDVQPPVVQIQTRNPNPEPNVAPVDTPVPKASIPFPSRRNDEKRKEKANDQIEKFYEIFRDLSFEISFTDALMLMPKFASTLKTLIGNKEKLSELARTPLNENCSAVILNEDVYGGEITLRVGKEAITFNLDQTSKYTADYDHMTANKIDVIEMLVMSILQEGPRISEHDRRVASHSHNSFLALEDDPTSSEVDPTYQDPEGDILILEAIFKQSVLIMVIETFVYGQEAYNFSKLATFGGLLVGHHGANYTARKIFDSDPNWPTIYKDAHDFVTLETICHVKEKIRHVMQMHKKLHPRNFSLKMKKNFSQILETASGLTPDGVASPGMLYLTRRSLEVLSFRMIGIHGSIHLMKKLGRMARDGVTSIKRRHRDQSSDGVRNMATASGRGRLKEDLESSTWPRCQDFKATLEKDIIPKDRKHSKRMTKPDSEWKSCEGQGQIKAKDQKSQSQSQLNKLTVKTGAVIEEYYWMQSQPI
ncbi:hypothetical protein Tco_0840158 [Tanacetum coccineum]|uniref:Reverse transcriptase domain-containing protein n=1 Tax=Tanacetum coccineum TaxID=301880 RepID=A0ABQ5ATX5_9ASTR